MPEAKRIHVLFHDAGGGHRNAAVALKAACEQQNRPWEINLVQFQDLTDHLDVLRRLTGIRIGSNTTFCCGTAGLGVANTCYACCS